MSKNCYCRQVQPGVPLPQHEVTRLINKQLLKRQKVAEFGGFRFPEPHKVRPDQLFVPDASLYIPSHPDLSHFEDAIAAKKGKKGKGRGKSGGSKGGGQKWPDPKIVLREVQQMLHGMPVAGNTGNIVVMEQNAEFGNLSKFKWFELAFAEVFSRGHVIFLEEVDGPGVSHIAKVLGYAGHASPTNSRGQGVAFLVHPRLKLIAGPTAYNSLLNVQGIPDLRPGWRIDLEDTVTGEKFACIVLHLKSMLGGPKVTAVVRYQQLQNLVNDLQTELTKIDNGAADAIGFIVGGDMNYKMDTNFNDADPLYNAGFKLLERWDHRGTQVMGPSRIDGLFFKGLKSKLDWYDVTPWFANKILGRSFTDHANLKCELCCVSSDSTSHKDDKASDNGTGGSTDGSDDKGDSTDAGSGSSAKSSGEPDIKLSFRAGEFPAQSGKKRSRR